MDLFDNKCLRRILQIQWQDHASTEELLLRKSRCETYEKEVKQGRWKMIGHTLKQEQNSHCNIVMTWAPEGKRRRARPKSTWRQTVEKERAEAGWRSWQEV